MNNNTLVQYAKSFIGEHLDVKSYTEIGDRERVVSYVMTEDGYCPGTKVVSSVSLHKKDLGLFVSDSDLHLRMEVMLAGLPENSYLEQALAQCALDIDDLEFCAYGTVLEDAAALRMFYLKSEMKHFVLLSPVFWPKYSAFVSDSAIVAWLYAVPISDNELDFMRENGLNALQDLLEEKEADVLDFYRPSVI